MKNYTKRYNKEDQLAEKAEADNSDQERVNVLKMVHNDLSYKRHGSLFHAYCFYTKYCMTRAVYQACHGINSETGPDMIASVSDLQDYLSENVLPGLHKDMQSIKDNHLIYKAVHNSLTKLSRSHKMQSLVKRSPYKANELPDLDFEAKQKLIRRDDDKQLQIIPNVIRTVNHEIQALVSLPNVYDNDVLVFHDGLSNLSKRSAKCDKKVNAEFYHGLPKSTIKAIDNQEEFMYEHNVHFCKALPKQLNKFFADDIAALQQSLVYQN